jgi:hypothetical protein
MFLASDRDWTFYHLTHFLELSTVARIEMSKEAVAKFDAVVLRLSWQI